MPFYRHYPHWLLCIVATVAASIYWGFSASDRYVSESNVVLNSSQLAPTTLSFTSLLGGGSGNSDMLLLRDYMMSVDMLRQIDTSVGFRSHYADNHIDFLSRLWDEQAPIEDLHDYYKKRVFVELDDYAQVLRIRVQAFNPEMAHKIAKLLLQAGETHMNSMGQRLAAEQVSFLEGQVQELNNRFNHARQQLLDYQNLNGLVSPTGTVESLSAVVANLEGELTTLKAKRNVLESYQSNSSPEVIRINAQINAVNGQIAQERARMAQQSGGALNSVSSEYQTLELKAQFAQESYSGALAALENTRIEAARKLKQVSILQSPTLPEYPVEPRRPYNITVFALISLFVGIILQMLIMIIKDHRD